MTIVPVSGWLCLICRDHQPIDGDPEPCCPNRFQIRVCVDATPEDIARVELEESPA